MITGVTGIGLIGWLCNIQNSNAWASSIMSKMMEKRSEVTNLLSLGNKPENSLTQAPRVFARYCAQCHPLPSPTAHTADDWSTVANRMFRIMSGMAGHTTNIRIPSPAEQDTIITYLKAHSSKSANLPSSRRQIHIQKMWSRNITLTTRLVDTVTTPLLLKEVQLGKLQPKRLITHEFGLDDMMKAYDTFSNAGREKARNLLLKAA